MLSVTQLSGSPLPAGVPTYAHVTWLMVVNLGVTSGDCQTCVCWSEEIHYQPEEIKYPLIWPVVCGHYRKEHIALSTDQME